MFNDDTGTEKRMCDVCGKNPAVYYMKTVRNGKVSERYLCESCKNQHGFIKTDIPVLGSLFASFGDYLTPGNEPSSVQCPTCGYSLRDYRKTGFLGCPDCYKAMESSIESSVVKLQKDVKHIGKSPKAFYSPEESQYNELLRKREEAVKNEDFRLAAQINDQMKKLKGGA